jgi:hypothetical protein
MYYPPIAPDDINDTVKQWFIVSYWKRINGMEVIHTASVPWRLSGKRYSKRPTRLYVIFDDPTLPDWCYEIEWKNLIELCPVVSEARG